MESGWRNGTAFTIRHWHVVVTNGFRSNVVRGLELWFPMEVSLAKPFALVTLHETGTSQSLQSRVSFTPAKFMRIHFIKHCIFHYIIVFVIQGVSTAIYILITFLSNIFYIRKHVMTSKSTKYFVRLNTYSNYLF